MSSLRPDPAGEYLKELLGVDFTRDQLDIATHPLSPQLVVAGAGSGKTMVMAARVVHAVAVQGVAPSEVLGLTFTNKAAGELGVRVRRSLYRLQQAGGLPATAGESDQTDLLDDLPTVATYNAYAAGIVRDHALRIAREPGLVLMSEAGQWQLATRVVRRATGPFEHLTWGTAYAAQRVLALTGELAEHLTDSAEVRRHDARLLREIEAGAMPTSAAVKELVESLRARGDLLELVDAYTAAKEQLDLIDFGDQVALAARIATTAPAVRAWERSRYRLVVLDEYQDTGVAQRILLSCLFGDGHAVVAVGDPNQAIYGWRGASVGNLLRFGEHFQRQGTSRPGAQPLMTSFRCGGRILAAANAIAAGIGQHAVDRRPDVAVPPLAAAPGREDAGQVVVTRVETDHDEARWVAKRISAQLAAGTPAGQVAVLARRRSDFARLHQALLTADVPVEVVGLGGLLQMPEVADVVAMLSMLADPSANPAAIRVLTGPRFRLGVRDLAALGERAAHLARIRIRGDADEPAVGASLEAALSDVTARTDPVDVPALLDGVDSPGDPSRYSAEAAARLARLRAELTTLRRLTGQPLVELVTELIRTIGLDVEIEAEPERVAHARAANLAAFVDHATRFTGLDGETDLAAFLGYLDAAVDAENGLDAGAVSTSDTVKLMTVHKAKGLEWDVVAVPGLVQGVFPSERGRPLWTKRGDVLPTPCRGDRDDLPRLSAMDPAGLKALKCDSDADDEDEERRLAYVAFTRARRLLLASGYCWGESRQKPVVPSPYLTQLRDLGPDAVVVDGWCDDPEPGTGHPLDGITGADVCWPVEPDEDGLARRRAAADAVLAAIRAPALVPMAEDTADDLGWSAQVRMVLGELRAERSPTHEVPLPRRLTASQVVQLAHDPVKLARSLARPMPQRPMIQARRGSRFHAWVESLWQATPLLDTDDLPGAGDADLTDAELERLQERFLADGWGELQPVAVERPFELVAGGRLLRGRIDAVYAVGADGQISATGDSSGGYDVIDYKTGAVPDDFAAASLQLSVYRLAWADLAGVEPARVRAGFLYVRTGQLKRPERLLDREELAALLAGAPVPR